MPDAPLEPGSFRDRSARVFYFEGGVFRGLSDDALRQWEALVRSAFFRQFTDRGAIVASARVEGDAAPPSHGDAWAAVLRHEAVPFVSYPYEWPFGMLREAALLQLDLLLAALDEGMTLKDASPYNVQWRGAAPVFVDVASFQIHAAGDPWMGYQQFCRMFLYPLFLTAYRDVPFQPWLRGSLEGIPAETCRSLLSPRDYLRPGVFTHVYLQARAASVGQDTGRSLRADLRDAGFSANLIRANARRLRTLVAGLSWRRTRSTWSEYGSCGHYEPADAERKRVFVREVLASRPWSLVWDLGCNTGAFARLAAEHARYVVALDADHLAVERLFRELAAAGSRNVLPLVGDVADPSPALGWRNRERTRLVERGRPDLVLCLALLHHLVIGANVPLPDVLDWLAELGGDLVIEFVTREDPMIAALLRNRDDQYGDYHLARFERALAERFDVARREPLGSGTRIMYHARSRGHA